jgi:hypothetical protein
MHSFHLSSFMLLILLALQVQQMRPSTPTRALDAAGLALAYGTALLALLGVCGYLLFGSEVQVRTDASECALPAFDVSVCIPAIQSLCSCLHMLLDRNSGLQRSFCLWVVTRLPCPVAFSVQPDLLLDLSTEALDPLAGKPLGQAAFLLIHVALAVSLAVGFPLLMGPFR